MCSFSSNVLFFPSVKMIVKCLSLSLFVKYYSVFLSNVLVSLSHNIISCHYSPLFCQMSFFVFLSQIFLYSSLYRCIFLPNAPFSLSNNYHFSLWNFSPLFLPAVCMSCSQLGPQRPRVTSQWHRWHWGWSQGRVVMPAPRPAPSWLYWPPHWGSPF